MMGVVGARLRRSPVHGPEEKHTITSRNEGRIYALLRFFYSKEKIENLLFTILK